MVDVGLVFYVDCDFRLFYLCCASVLVWCGLGAISVSVLVTWVC